MQLSCIALQATNVPKMGFLTKADPYLVIKLSSSNSEYRTNHCENTLTPVWNQRFEFMINDISTDLLVIHMKDWDSVDQHKNISRLEIPVRTIPINQTTELWYEMVPCVDKPSGGRLRLVLQISPIHRNPPPPPVAPYPVYPQAPPQPVYYPPPYPQPYPPQYPPQYAPHHYQPIKPQEASHQPRVYGVPPVQAYPMPQYQMPQYPPQFNQPPPGKKPNWTRYPGQ